VVGVVDVGEGRLCADQAADTVVGVVLQHFGWVGDPDVADERVSVAGQDLGADALLDRAVYLD
jgi:hypothetical protein